MKPAVFTSVFLLLLSFYCAAQTSDFEKKLNNISDNNTNNVVAVFNKTDDKIDAFEEQERIKEQERLRKIFKERCAENSKLLLADVEKLNNLLQYPEITYFEQIDFYFIYIQGNSLRFPETDTTQGFTAQDVFCLPDTFSIYNYPHIKKALEDHRLILENNTKGGSQIDKMPENENIYTDYVARELEVLIHRLILALDKKYPKDGYNLSAFRTTEKSRNFTTLKEIVDFRTNVIVAFSKKL